MVARRGDVYWADLADEWGHRPVAIVTRDSAARQRSAVCIAIITSRIRGLHSEVGLNEQDGLPRPCVISCDNLLTVPKSRLKTHITHLSRPKHQELNRALRFALELD